MPQPKGGQVPKGPPPKQSRVFTLDTRATKWRPLLCRLRLHKWRYERRGVGQYQYDAIRCLRCPESRRIK